VGWIIFIPMPKQKRKIGGKVNFEGVKPKGTRK
jgi:hypothetical protein